MRMLVTDVFAQLEEAINTKHTAETALERNKKWLKDRELSEDLLHKIPDAELVLEGDYFWRGIVMMGGSRSGKTYAIIQKFTVMIVTEEGKVITCWRNEAVTAKATVMEDFKTIKYSDEEINDLIGENVARARYYGKDTKSEIMFAGTDNIGKVLGRKQHISFFNEITEFNESVFKQVTQRTSDFWIADYNPSKSFWLEKMLSSEDILVLHFTYEHNAFCPAPIVKQLNSYNPFHPADKDLPRAKRRPHPVNVKNGTANEYLYDVYCLGIKAEKPGKIYNKWESFSVKDYELLPHTEFIGLDFGQVSPSGMVRVKYDGDVTIFVDELLYKPINLMKSLEHEIDIVYPEAKLKSIKIIADSAGKTRIQSMQRAGFTVTGARKGNHSVVPGISIVQKYKIVFTTRSGNFIAEYDGYAWKLDRYGIPTDEPEKVDDHLMDALRYIIEYIDTNFGHFST